MKKNPWPPAAVLTGSALFLRFALRGYAWWGYACLFAAALLLLHRYLPAGLWQDIRSGEVLEGGATVRADAPLDSIPVFRRVTEKRA